MDTMDRKLIACLIMMSLLLSGCSGAGPFIKKMILGSSLEDFNTANTKREQTFALSPEECYKRIHEFFAKIHANVSTDDPAQGFIVAVRFELFFGSCTDSTEVAVVISVPKQGSTALRVMSYNSDLANVVADSLFSYVNEPTEKVESKLLPKLDSPFSNKKSELKQIEGAEK